MNDDLSSLANESTAHRIAEFLAGFVARDNASKPKKSVGSDDLSTRLFRDFERRKTAIVWASMDQAASDIKARSVFIHERVLIFAKPSQNTMNLQVWLETIFGLDVVIVHEPKMFNEWLFRHVASVDFLIVEQDSFTDHSSFSRFMAKAREVADDLPLIVMGSNFKSNDFEPSWHDPWDISLRMPLSQTSCWLTLKATANLTLNGRL